MQTTAAELPTRGLQEQPISPGSRRLVASGVAFSCAAVLGLAAFMTPSAEGIGTHKQLNLPACGWISIMDLPCVTCGMTTAFSHAARGSLLQSLLAQPMGFLLAMATAMTLLVAMHVAMTGSQLPRLFGRMWTPRTLWLIVAVAGASWLFKIVTYKGLLT